MTLYKKTNKGNIRYYIIDIYASLFGGYNVERIYGNINLKLIQEKGLIILALMRIVKIF